MWKRLAVYPSSKCLRQCPFCYLKEIRSPDLPLAFFEEVLEHSGKIGEWIFSVDALTPMRSYESRLLVNTALRFDHPYSIMINHEKVTSVDLEMLRRARQITVGWDEYKAPGREEAEFWQTLNWCMMRDVKVRVEIALSDAMIEKMKDTILMGRLLDQADRVRVTLPKTTPDFPPLSREKFDEFLEYNIMRMRLDLRYIAKLEFDPCLYPELNRDNPKTNGDCPHLQTLHVMPDGSIRLCPFGRNLGMLEEPAQIEDFIKRELTEKEKDEFNHCYWREAWADEDPDIA